MEHSSKLSHRLSFISNKVEKIVVNSNATKYLLVNKFNLKNMRLNKRNS